MNKVLFRALIGLTAMTTVAGGCARSATVESATMPEAQVVPQDDNAIPAGTALEVRLNQTLGTETSKAGDEFTATVTESVRAQNGEIVVPAGATVYGRVTGLKDSDNVGDPAAIRLDFERLSFGGRTYAFEAAVVSTELQKRGDTTEETLKKAGVGAAAGAVLGAVIGDAELKNILLGAAIGAAAGTVISLGAGDVEAVLPAGTELQLQSTQYVSLR